LFPPSVVGGILTAISRPLDHRLAKKVVLAVVDLAILEPENIVVIFHRVTTNHDATV
jgi:phenylpyruvate tautomerase PptA (4-oxalocrotonate tautomerase family)